MRRPRSAAGVSSSHPAGRGVCLGLDDDCPARRKFLARLQGEINRRGTIDVLRKGIKDGPRDFDLFYGTPSPGNQAAADRFGLNRFTVSRQLRYSKDDTQKSLDIALFINGLPVFTFELKNSLTKQTVNDAIWQYRRDRNPREPLFRLGRCVAHFAVDDNEVYFCTHLQGKKSWFLPFNRGWDSGAGNPPNPNGLKTDYFWRQVLSRGSVTDILENYAQVLKEKDERTGRTRSLQVWPRYQQLDVVRRLLADAGRRGSGAQVPDPALGRQWQELFDCLARPSADPAATERDPPSSIRSSWLPTAESSTARSGIRSAKTPR